MTSPPSGVDDAQPDASAVPAKLGPGKAVSRTLTSGALSGASQGLGVVQLVLLLHGGAGSATDAYFYLLAWTTVPIQLLLVSTAYPLMLKYGRSNRRSELKSMLAVTVATFIAAVVGAWLFSAVATSNSGLARLTLLSAATAAVSVWPWQRCLVLSATGDARWLAAINILPSLFAIPLLVISDSNASSQLDRVSSLLIGQLCGFAAFGLLVEIACRRSQFVHVEGNVQGRGVAGVWFFAQSGSAYGSILAMQSVGVGLPPAGYTVYGATSRVASGAVALVSAAVLPVLVNRSSDQANAAIWFVRALLPCGLLGAYLVGFVDVIEVDFLTQYRGIFVIGWVWFIAATFNAVMHRVAYRFHTPRLSVITIIVSPVIAGFTILLSANGFTLERLLWCFVALDLVCGIVYAFALRKYVLAILFIAFPFAVALIT